MMNRAVRPMLLLLALALAVPAASVAQVATAPEAAELAGLEDYIRDALVDWEIPGLAIAVVKDDRVVFSGGFGERELGTGLPVDDETLFAIASTTKAMTVAGLGMLVSEGALDWDDRVSEYLPHFELEDPYVTRHLTIRDLLTHRTGVSRSDNVWIAAPFDRAEIVRRARHLPQVDGFRDGYGYNNIMYMVAGEVLAAAAGVPWATFIQTRLFEPLGMERSTPRSAVVARRENVAASHVRSDGRILAIQHRDYDALGPAGSVFSSARDMAQWLRLHLNDGVYEGRRLLDSAVIAEMHEPQVVMSIDSTSRRMFPSTHFRAYGLGWRMQDYHGYKIVQHTGAVNYMRTQVGMVPEAGLGIVVLANQSSSELQTALMYRVFDALLGLPETDWSAQYLVLEHRSNQRSEERSAEVEASRMEGTRPSLPIEAYAGTYADSLFGEVRVVLEGDGLVLRYSPDYTADLQHWHHDTFRANWRRAGFGHTDAMFSLDASGKVRSLEITGFTTFGRVRTSSSAAVP